MAKEKVTKDMIIREVVEKYPDSINVFLEYGVLCFSCPVASQETIENGLKSHGFSDEEIEEIVDKINKAVEKGGEKDAENNP